MNTGIQQGRRTSIIIPAPPASVSPMHLNTGHCLSPEELASSPDRCPSVFSRKVRIILEASFSFFHHSWEGLTNKPIRLEHVGICNSSVKTEKTQVHSICVLQSSPHWMFKLGLNASWAREGYVNFSYCPSYLFHGHVLSQVFLLNSVHEYQNTQETIWTLTAFIGL